MSLRTERRDQTHAAILESAEHFLRERGIAGTSVAEVMKRAGLTVGGFYAHFDSKEALLETALRNTMRYMWKQLLTGVRGETPGARAYHVLRRYLSTRHRDSTMQGCPLPSTVAEITHEGSPYTSVLDAELREFVIELGPLISDTKSAGRTRALGMLCLMYGALSLARAVKDSSLSNELLAAAADFGRAATLDTEV